MTLQNKKYLILIMIAIIYLTGCSNPNTLSNKQYDFDIYRHITISINQGNEKQAQDGLLNLISTYPKSELIKPSMLLFINYYTQSKEYKIANFYLKRLKERFFNPLIIDYFAYLDAQLEYKKISSDNKNQLDVINTMKLLEEFLDLYPDSKYKYNVATMYSHLYLTNILNNEYIANLYDDIDKKESALFYREKNQDLDKQYIIKPKKNIIKRIFQ